MIVHFEVDHEPAFKKERARKCVLRRLCCMQSIWWLAGLIAILFLNGKPAYAHTPNSAQDANSWVQEYLLNPAAHPPFSFVYGRQASEPLLKAWPRTTASKQLGGGRTEHTIIWTDPRTRLRVHFSAVTNADSPVVEWNIHFANDGNVDTPILEEIQALDVSVPVIGQSPPTVIYSRGCGGMDTYALRKQPLNQLESLHLANQGGGKTVDTIPFFDIHMDGRGLIGAVGWPGTWSITFSRPTEGAIAVTAGMQKTHLVLHAGEEIRTPHVLLLPWSGDDIDAHNVLRRHVHWL
jgi:alpha-galactosidase